MAMTAADMIVHVGADVKDAVSGLNQVGSAVDKGGAGIGRASLLMGGIAGAAVAGFGLAVGSAMNFEGAMADVSASLGTTEDEYKQLSTLALNIGRDTAFSATQGAQAIEELGKAGVSVTDIMGGAGMAAAQLASATGTDIPTAAGVMSNALNAFQLSGDQSARVADVMTAALNESSLSMGDFANGMASAGSIAASLGIPIEDTAGALAIFSNYGMSGADAGTSLRTMLTRLAAPTDEARQLMTDLGISAFDASGEFIGMEGLAGQLKSQLAGMSDEQRMAALNTMFGADAMRVANILYQEGAEGVEAMNAKMQSNGQAAEAAQRRLGGLRGAMEQLKGSIETAFILFGSMFTPVLTKVAAGINKLVNGIIAMSPRLKTLVAAVAGGIGAFAGLAAGIGVLMSMSGPLVAGFGASASGLALISAPVLALIAVGALLYMAWSNNWLGLRDIISSVVGAVVGYFGQLGGYIADVASGGKVLTDSLNQIPAPMRNITLVIGALVDGIIDFVNVLAGGGGLSEAWAEFTDTFKTGPVQDALSGLGEQILGAFTSIDWGAVGSALLTGLGVAASYLGGWTMTLLGYLGDLAGALGGWLLEQASAVDWAGILSSAASLAGDIAQDIVSGLGNLTSALASWLWGQAASVDWAGILSSAASLAGDIVSTIVTKLGDLGMGLKTWYDTAINSVDWGNLGFTVGEKVGDLTSTLAPKAWDLITGFGNAITENWQTILLVIGGLVLGLPAAMGYLYYTLAPKALEFIQGFVAGLGINWALIGDWLAGLPGKMLAAVPGLASTLLDKGIELIQGIVSGLNQHWPTVSAWLSLAGSLALAAIGSLASTLLSKGVELVQGIVDGLVQHWPTVSAWLANVAATALAAVPGLATTLLTKGQELISGILSGLTQYWPDVSSWLGQLGAAALASIPGLASALLQVGIDLLVGVLTGLQQHWPTVVAWLGLLGSLALAAVGSLASTLLSRGVELIRGVITGIQNTWPQMRAWLSLLGSLAFQAVGSLVSTLLARGVELIQGAITGMANRWPQMRSDLAAIGPAAFAAVGSLAQTIYSRGVELLQGMANGAAAGWVTVQGNLAAIPGAAASAVGDLGGALVNAGYSLMMGLKDGIASGWGEVTGYLSSLNPAEWKGPPERDRRMLIGNGLLTMEGYQEGLSKGWRDTTRMLQGMSPVIPLAESFGQTPATVGYNGLRQAGAGFGATSQSSSTVIHYVDNRSFTVSVDDLPEVQQAADLIRDLQRDHELVYGAV